MGNKSYFISEKFLRLLSSILSVSIIAKVAEISDTADFFKLILVIGLILPLAFFGTESNFITKYSQDKSVDWVTNTLIFTFFTSSVCAVIYVLIGSFYFNNFEYLFALSFLLYQPFLSVVYNYFYCHSSFKLNFFVHCFLVITTIIKFFLYLNFNLTFFYMIYVLDYIFPLVLLNCVYYSKYRINLKVDRKKIVYLMKKGLPMLLSAIVINTFSKVDQMMLIGFVDEIDFNNFSLASRLSQGLLIVPSLFVGLIYPDLLKALGVCIEKAKQLIKRQLSFYYLICSTVIIFIFFASKEIFTYVYGVEFELASEVFFIQSFTLIFTVLGMINSRLAVYFDKQNHVLICNVLALFANVALNFIFIPVYGAIGAAYVTLATQLFSSYLYWKVVKIV